MKHLILLFVFIWTESILNSQTGITHAQIIDEPSIERILNPNLDYIKVHKQRASKIECEWNNEIGTMGTILEIDTINFHIIETRLFNGDTIQKRHLFLDNTYQIQKIVKFITRLSGETIADTTYYSYKNQMLESIVRRYNNQIEAKHIISCDKFGNPVKIVAFNSRNQLIGIEEAIYEYEINQYTKIVKDAFQKVQLKETIPFADARDPEIRYNEFGDKIVIPLNENNCKIYEYTYDNSGNWIIRKEFNGKIKKDNTYSKRNLIYTIKRKIKY